MVLLGAQRDTRHAGFQLLQLRAVMALTLRENNNAVFLSQRVVARGKHIAVVVDVLRILRILLAIHRNRSHSC